MFKCVERLCPRLLLLPWILYPETLELVQTVVEVIGRQGIVFSGDYFLDHLRSFTSLTPHFCLHSFLCSSNFFVYSLVLVSGCLCSLEWVSWCLEEHFSAIYCWLRLGTRRMMLLGASWLLLCGEIPIYAYYYFLALFLFLKISYSCFMSMSICLHVCLCTMCVFIAHRSLCQISWSWTYSCEALCECWGLK